LTRQLFAQKYEGRIDLLELFFPGHHVVEVRGGAGRSLQCRIIGDVLRAVVQLCWSVLDFIWAPLSLLSPHPGFGNLFLQRAVADMGHLANIAKDTQAAKCLPWEAAVSQVSGSCWEQAQPSHRNVSEQENTIKIKKVKLWLLMSFQEERW